MAKQDQGKIVRTEQGFSIHVKALDDRCTRLPGVVCENPDAEPKDRKYIKQFTDKRIYLPGQYNKAIKEVLEGRNVLRLGFNGYSIIDEERQERWGVSQESYEAACSKLAYEVISFLKHEFPGIDLRLVNGAADIGIDRAINQVAESLNLPVLGFNCPRYMVWVKDGDDHPVYVAKNNRTYSDCFVKSLDILVAANGADTAYKHDVDTALSFFKHFIPVDVVSTISTTGGVPAFGPNGKVENAVKAYAHLVHVMSRPSGMSSEQAGFDGIVDYVRRVCKDVCRQKLEPRFAFPIAGQTEQERYRH